MKAPHPVDAFEAEVIANAEYFTAFIQVRPGERYNVRKESEAEARDEAAALANHFKRSSLVYAVNPQGRQALVTTIHPERTPR